MSWPDFVNAVVVVHLSTYNITWEKIGVMLFCFTNKL